MTRFAFPAFRIPRHIAHDGIRLRPLKIADLSFIRNGLWDTDVSAPSCLTVWWWLKKTYPIFFCIEVASKSVGFIGLHNLKSESAEVTLVICQPADRCHGYASRAYRALASRLSQSSFFKEMIVRVTEDNQPSLSFWKKNGFDELETVNGAMTLVKDLGRSQRKRLR